MVELRKMLFVFEVKSVSWLVCERMRIKSPSEEYLNGYLQNNEKIPKISVDVVLKSVGWIESMINVRKKLRKENNT